jgi:hypothetical protein
MHVTSRGYPNNWPTISRATRKRAGYKCEACGVENGQTNPITGRLVVLAAAHLDQQPKNCDPDNLRALCQKCHAAYDAAMRHGPEGETYRAWGVAAPISRQTGQPDEWLAKLRRNDTDPCLSVLVREKMVEIEETGLAPVLH